MVKLNIYELGVERERRLVREDEREIVRKEGIEVGRAESLWCMMALNKIFLANSRIDNVRKEIEDEIYLAALCEEFSI